MKPARALSGAAVGVAVIITLLVLAGRGRAAPDAALGTAFTYQGRLEAGGLPVTRACDFQFGLWDAPAGGSPIGSTVTATNVPVDEGLFTTAVDFGVGAFTGDGRWLALAVRCPAGSGSYTPLSPRQPLTAAPYALALPGLYTRSNPSSPNLIGGHSVNSVSANVAGAVIGGGGSNGIPNRVTDNFSVVGGYNNLAGNNAGDEQDAAYVFVGGGGSNSASSAYTVIAGGWGNTANDDAAAIGGGWANQAVSSYATIPGGTKARTKHHGELAYAAGSFADIGDAQMSLYVLRDTSTDATATPLFLDGTRERLTIAEDRALAFDILVVASGPTGGNIAGYQIRGLVQNFNGTIWFVGSPTVTVLGEDNTAWDVAVAANNTNDSLDVLVTGVNGVTIRWVASVRTVEVRFP